MFYLILNLSGINLPLPKPIDGARKTLGCLLYLVGNPMLLLCLYLFFVRTKDIVKVEHFLFFYKTSKHPPALTPWLNRTHCVGRVIKTDETLAVGLGQTFPNIFLRSSLSHHCHPGNPVIHKCIVLAVFS